MPQQVSIAPEGDDPALFEGVARTEDGRIQVMVELEEPAAAVVFAEAIRVRRPPTRRSGASPRTPRALPGVKRVLPIQLEYPTNSTSVPFIGTPNVWANTIAARLLGRIRRHRRVHDGRPCGGTVISYQRTVNFDADGNGTNESSVLTDDPATTAPTDPTAVAIGSASIPALSPLALLFLSALLGGIALLVMRRMA